MELREQALDVVEEAEVAILLLTVCALCLFRRRFEQDCITLSDSQITETTVEAESKCPFLGSLRNVAKSGCVGDMESYLNSFVKNATKKYADSNSVTTTGTILPAGVVCFSPTHIYPGVQRNP